jgi:paraquat-inducible protein B
MNGVPASARRRRPSLLSAIWLVPILAAGTAILLLKEKVYEKGPLIEIVFNDAQGLVAGKSDLFYRGAALGYVQSLALDEENRVVARVQLARSAGDFAREGARFWLVRAQVGAGGIKGLSTLATGPIIAATPGKGEPKERFEALASPPVVERRGLELVLIAGKAGWLSPGSPVLYRGVRVGTVGNVTLADDARAVRAALHIEKPYEGLVREGSQFWSSGGLDFKFGLLKGAEVSADSLATMIGGGVSFATPDPPGKRAAEGRGFMLAEKPEEAWLRWAPAISLPPRPAPTQTF